MRVTSFVSCFCLSLMTLWGQGRVVRGQVIPWPPTSGTSHFILDPAPGSQPQSLSDLCTSALVIVDSSIQAVLPVREILASRRLETDVVVVVNNVMKGPRDIKNFVITQRGGVLGGYVELPTQYGLMRTGDHYLLFVENDRRPNIPPVQGLSRYWIT
jgi:hypothetical protein